MHTSNNIPNSFDAAFAATYASFLSIFEETSAAAPIVEDEGGWLLDDNGGETGGVNKTVDEIIFNMVSYSLHKRYSSVRKVILKYCFDVDNN